MRGGVYSFNSASSLSKLARCSSTSLAVASPILLKMSFSKFSVRPAQLNPYLLIPPSHKSCATNNASFLFLGKVIAQKPSGEKSLSSFSNSLLPSAYSLITPQNKVVATLSKLSSVVSSHFSTSQLSIIARHSASLCLFKPFA